MKCKNCNTEVDFNVFTNCWKCGSDVVGNHPKEGEFKSQKLKKSDNKGGIIGVAILIILIIGMIKIKDSNFMKSHNKTEEESNQSDVESSTPIDNEGNSSNSDNGYADDYETNDTYFKGGEKTEYTQGNDGKIYENNACSMCKGTGIEENRSTFSDEAGRICPMCDGAGVRSY